MPDGQGRLYAGEIAEQAGISPSDFRARVSRGHAPAAAGYVKGRAVWDPQVVAEYLERRKVRLAGRLPDQQIEA